MFVQYVGKIVKSISEALKSFKKNPVKAIAFTSTAGLAASEIE